VWYGKLSAMLLIEEDETGEDEKVLLWGEGKLFSLAARRGESKRGDVVLRNKESSWRLDCYYYYYYYYYCILIPHTLHSASPFVLTAACLAGVVWLVSLARAWKDHVTCATADRQSSHHLFLARYFPTTTPTTQYIDTFPKHESFLPCGLPRGVGIRHHRLDHRHV
jgi:hypothetical protein